MNSYGKTWHTWHTWHTSASPGDRLPLGDPKLMWSFNHDGEAGEHLKRDFQQHMAIDEAGKRPHRQAFAELAHPSTASTRWPASSPAPRPWRPWWTPRPAVRPR